MSYCINPKCQQRLNPDDLENCQACGSSLIINERYRLIRPLRSLDGQHLSEIFEIDNLGTLKVLKVLTSNRGKLVELFQREVQVLQRLKHPGIPAVDTYFVFSPSNSSRELHCLVMEKIEGQDLKQWLEKHGPISEVLALDWLQQLVNILAQVHGEQLLHRDIKPSNIMLRPCGQLVLIDFGAVRELTPTYIDKLGGHDVTRIYSQGYTAPEQYNGQAVSQSDFFALGRTFVHLLTGTYPDDLPNDPQTNQLVWRQAAPVSASLGDLIDQLIAPLPQHRPQNAQVILARLITATDPSATSITRGDSIVEAPIEPQYAKTKSNPGTRSWQHLPSSRWRQYLQMLLAGTIITALVMGVRYLGVFQPLELRAFDQMLQLRPEEGADPRLLVITIGETDIRSQKQREGSLSDHALAQLLEKLEQYQPRAIGLDIYRDFPVEPAYRRLAARLRQNEHFIAVCKHSDSVADPDGVPPPPEVPKERVGFSDSVDDSDNILRRQFLFLTPDPASPCSASYSFSALLAFHYLQSQGISPRFTSDGNLQLGKTVFSRLKAHMGGYQKVDAGGNQVILNYHSSHLPQKIAAQVTLTQILNNQVNPKFVQGRIVLIGATGTTSGDYWSTPYATGPDEKVPGVFMQAQMVSQILSAVLDQRPLIWVWPTWNEALWIWGWSVAGGILTCYCQRLFRLGIAGGIALGVLASVCFGLLLTGGWVPLVPAAIALVATVGTCRSSLRKRLS